MVWFVVVPYIVCDSILLKTAGQTFTIPEEKTLFDRFVVCTGTHRLVHLQQLTLRENLSMAFCGKNSEFKSYHQRQKATLPRITMWKFNRYAQSLLLLLRHPIDGWIGTPTQRFGTKEK
ncbi:hypothetical protein HOLleu_27762 [Holothuria leucospilota]|uniref:Uncharacterized protein n=1 Tax=Holothuria leucospilota TaxID=206669 RepID=A0A9Q1BQU3_HOLLE|nr:hypothetical protein HOLleu_27762 [Holothuria leucospilota]